MNTTQAIRAIEQRGGKVEILPYYVFRVTLGSKTMELNHVQFIDYAKHLNVTSGIYLNLFGGVYTRR